VQHQPANPIDGAALYAACQAHGSTAQIDAYQQLSGQLYRIAYAMLRDRPGGADLAADCMQAALIKIHQNLEQCRDPAAFRGWAAQTLRRTVIDTTRQIAATKLVSLPEHDYELPASAIVAPSEPPDDLEQLLRQAIASAPLSDRSRRVVIGRFFDERSDAELAQDESAREGQQVLPSHIQVTRAKNLAKLRAEPVLIAALYELLGA
jgi:RNA polymerase sigma factor (sigma-70 family)